MGGWLVSSLKCHWPTQKNTTYNANSKYECTCVHVCQLLDFKETRTTYEVSILVGLYCVVTKHTVSQHCSNYLKLEGGLFLVVADTRSASNKCLP